MTVAITQNDARIIGAGDSADVHFARTKADILGSEPAPIMQFTRGVTTVGGLTVAPTILLSRAHLQVLGPRTNTFEYHQMVYPDVFPFDISYNSVGSIRFATDVVVVDSGDDQRVSRWDQPLQEYDVAYGVRSMEQLHALMGFFRSMRGRLYAFCYQDWLDYTSSVATQYEARAAPPITAFDQLIGIGDGVKKQFQLTKTYATTSQSLIRPITRPQPGTTLLGLGGAQTTHFAVDETNGIVTCQIPKNLTIAHGLAKDVASGGGHISTITGIAGDFSSLIPYIGFRVIIAGWTNPQNNVDQFTTGNYINAVAGDGSTINIQYEAAHGNLSESAVTGVLFSIHPAPQPGVSVTAGFKFYVPVRFDTDTLPVTLEHYGIGSSNSVKLIEVRPTDPQ